MHVEFQVPSDGFRRLDISLGPDCELCRWTQHPSLDIVGVDRRNQNIARYASSVGSRSIDYKEPMSPQPGAESYICDLLQAGGAAADAPGVVVLARVVSRHHIDRRTALEPKRISVTLAAIQVRVPISKPIVAAGYAKQVGAARRRYRHTDARWYRQR